MLNLQKIAADHIKKLESEGAIKKAVEEGIEKSITHAIERQFESSGDFSKQVNEVIKTGLKIDPTEIDLQVYNHQMTMLLKQRLGNMFEGRSRDRFLEELESILEPAPEEVDIACLVKKVVSLWSEEQASFFDDDVDEYATVTLERDDCGKGTYKLKMTNGSKHSSTGQIASTGQIDLWLHDGKIAISHRMKTNPTVLYRSADAYIFKLHAAGTKVVGLESYDPEDHEEDLRIHDGEDYCSC